MTTQDGRIDRIKANVRTEVFHGVAHLAETVAQQAHQGCD